MTSINLFDYQKEGVSFLKSRRVALLADEPGLGKTCQALSSVDEYPVLIICPASLKYVWEDEIKKWKSERGARVVTIKTPIVESVLSGFYICSYSMLNNSKVLDTLKKIDFKAYIFDEAHYLKNTSTARFKNSLGKEGVVNKGNRVMLLTGTPIINRPSELYGWMSSLCPEIMGKAKNYYVFIKTFCDAKKIRIHTSRGVKTIIDSSGSSNHERLKKMMEPIILRREKRQVLKELPEKFFQVVQIDPGQPASIAIKKEKNLIKSLDFESEIHKTRFSDIAKIRQEIALSKIFEAVKLIKNQLLYYKKIVVFVHHKEVGRQLFEKLIDFKPVLFNGDMKDAHRRRTVNQFQNDESTRIFIGNMTAAGVGITLTAAHYLIFIEMPFSPSELNQCVDRCSRIGQKNPVLAHFLVYKNSYDSNMIRNMIEKEKCFHKLFGRAA